MKGLAIYSVIVLSLCNLSWLWNILEGANTNALTIIMLSLEPILVFTILFLSKKT